MTKQQGAKTMQITKTSMFTGNTATREIPVTQEELDDWASGTLIQDAMPSLSADDREFLMTGATPEEWDRQLEWNRNFDSFVGE